MRDTESKMWLTLKMKRFQIYQKLQKYFNNLELNEVAERDYKNIALY